MEKVVGLRQSTVPSLKHAIDVTKNMRPMTGGSSLSYEGHLKNLSPYPYPYSRDYGFGYLFTRDLEQKTIIFTFADGYTEGANPILIEEQDYILDAGEGEEANMYLFVIRPDHKKIGIIKLHEDMDFVEEVCYFMSEDEEHKFTEDSSDENKVDWKIVKLLYYVELEKSELTKILRCEGDYGPSTEFFKIRTETENDAVTVYVYAPKEHDAFYGSGMQFPIDEANTWDANDEWVRLSFTDGDIYAYLELAEDGSLPVTGTTVQFSNTEMDAEENICVKIGTVTNGVVKQSFIGPYCISSTALPLVYPWKTSIVKEGTVETVRVRIGRVFETARIFQGSPTFTDFDYSFAEFTNNNSLLTPGKYFETNTSIVTIVDEYISIVVERETSTGEFTTNYEVGIESTLNTNSSRIVVKRIARITKAEGEDAVVEQIHMGDVTFSQYRVHAFALALYESAVLMYLPTGSININKKDFTAEATGISDGLFTDWKVVTAFGTDGLNMYIEMSNADGEYGRPVSVTFAAEAPSAVGELITVPILKTTTGGLVNIVNSAINMMLMRCDSQGSDTYYKSLSMSDDDGGVDSENATLQIKGFRTAVAPSASDLFDELDDYTYWMALRQQNSQTGKSDVVWWGLDNLEDKICEMIEDQLEECTSLDFCLSTEFICWYCTLEEGPFWEKGRGENINYGTRIGDHNANLAIALDTHILEGCWSVNGDLVVQVLEANHVCTCSFTVLGPFSIAGYVMEVCTTDWTLRVIQ